MDRATQLFEKHWLKRTGKPLDETTRVHMQYAIDAINEALTLSEVHHDDDPIDIDDEENEFEPYANCDLPDACGDFGCAIKQGLRDIDNL